MQIDLNTETEQLVRRFMVAGGFHTPEELLVSVLRDMASEDQSRDLREQQRLDSWASFERKIDPMALAAEQGVRPISKSGDLEFPNWPADDSVDDFIARAKGRDTVDHDASVS